MAKMGYYGLPRMVKYTVTKENYYNLEEVLGNMAVYGVKWLQVKPYNRIEVEKVDSQYELTSDQVLGMSDLLLGYKKEHPNIRVDLLPLCYEFLVDDDVEVSELSPCNCGKGDRGYLVIGPDGAIRICGAYPEPIGNANFDNISNLWVNNSLLKEVRNLANRPKPEECELCDHWEKCSITDCHSATFAKFGNFGHGNPQCPKITMGVV